MMASFFTQESNDPKISGIQKQSIRAFKLLGFEIEIMSNQKIMNFLDISFNLTENSCKPYPKYKQTPSYINVNSYHTGTIIRQIPNDIIVRIRLVDYLQIKSFYENNIR